MSPLSLSPSPSLLVAFFHCFGVKSHSLLSCVCTSCIIEGRSRRSERGREEGKEGESTNSCDTGTHGEPLNGATGGNVQRTDGECVQGEFAVLSTPDTPKLLHITFFESPTFVS